jgi:hypothetical protein
MVADSAQLTAADPREQLRRLPDSLQLPLTWLTGKAYRGQRGPSIGPTFHLVTAVLSTAAGVACTAVAITAGSWWWAGVLPGWAMTLHGMRNMRMMLFHQCAHRNMWRRRRADRALGEVLAALLVVQDFDAYSREHVVDHHAVHHMTMRDPTVQAILRTLEMHPGMSRREMWRILLRKLVSPAYHATFFLARLQSLGQPATPARRAATVGGYAALATVLTWTGGWTVFLVGWVIPLTVLFQISNTLRLCVKHTFPPPGSTLTGREHFASMTNAIFLCSAPPAGDGSRAHRAVAWLRWWAGLLLVHFPSRYLVLTGDTVCHDFHHRHPMARNWADYIHARQQDLEQGHPGWPPYRAAWGLVPAINRVFDSLSEADPRVYDVAALASMSRRAGFLAFDD